MNLENSVKLPNLFNTALVGYGHSYPNNKCYIYDIDVILEIIKEKDNLLNDDEAMIIFKQSVLSSFIDGKLPVFMDREGKYL